MSKAPGRRKIYGAACIGFGPNFQIAPSRSKTWGILKELGMCNWGGLFLQRKSAVEIEGYICLRSGRSGSAVTVFAVLMLWGSIPLEARSMWSSCDVSTS